MTTESITPRHTDAEIEQWLEQLWESNRRTPKLPRWLPLALGLLPYVLISVTLINGLIGIVAIITPIIAAGSWSGLSAPIYHAYSYICPQRPDHTFFLGGHPMAFEQRDLAMHLGFAAAGLLYLRARFLRKPLPVVWLVAGLAPMTIDVFLSTVGWLPATAVSRSWTGALASFAIVWWSYPRFDAMLASVQDHVAQVRRRIAEAQPEPEWIVLSKSDSDRLRTNASE